MSTASTRTTCPSYKGLGYALSHAGDGRPDIERGGTVGRDTYAFPTRLKNALWQVSELFYDRYWAGR